MHWILNLDILFLVSGIARKHGIVSKLFFGRPQYFPPQQKIIFFQEQEISWEREFVASQIGDYKKIFLIVQTYLGGQSYYPPPFNPPNPVSFRIGHDNCVRSQGHKIGATRNHELPEAILDPKGAPADLSAISAWRTNCNQSIWLNSVGGAWQPLDSFFMAGPPTYASHWWAFSFFSMGPTSDVRLIHVIL